MLALIDNDVRTADPRVAKAEQAGATIIRWDVGHRIEAQICSQLDANELQDFISLRVERRGAESTVLDDINSRGRARMPNLTVEDWLLIYSIEDARGVVALAASKRGWFKDVNAGRALGEWLLARRNSPNLAAVFARLDQIRVFVYGAPPETQPGVG